MGRLGHVRAPRRVAQTVALVGALAACGGCGLLGRSEWESLFNGEDLAGFHMVGQAAWHVEGGEIVGRQGEERPGGGWLVTDRAFGNFDLTLEFRTSYGANSGVVIRDPKGCEGVPYRDGYEIQIFNKRTEHYPTGSLYGLSSAPRGRHREGRWNELRLVARRASFAVYLNGEPVAAAQDERSLHGAIGLQVSSGSAYRPMWVRFRRIRIREVSIEGDAGAGELVPPEPEEETPETPETPEAPDTPEMPVPPPPEEQVPETPPPPPPPE